MKPLTIEELKALEVGDWVWIKILDPESVEESFPKQAYFQKADITVGENFFPFVLDECEDGLDYQFYGSDWLAYKNKELAEAKTESAVDEYISDLEDKKEWYKQESHYWYGQANRNYEDCHNGWTEQIHKEVAKEILHDLHVRVCQAAMVQKEGTEEELCFLPTKAITDFIDCLKSHYEVEVE